MYAKVKYKPWFCNIDKATIKMEIPSLRQKRKGIRKLSKQHKQVTASKWTGPKRSY